ncbi:MAG: winged helix DNA-binding domain-containing protein [Actinomycetota bacterium]|nr:winged helix DNA-binding domain-containing protein [Actinomycetota bacterium]
MTRQFPEARVRKLRLRSQLLAGATGADVHDAVRHMGALQAQSTPASRLSLRPRTSGLDVGDVTRACNEERSIVRTWTLRGTLHMVAASDVGWMVALLGPGFAERGRRRRHQLGLDDQVCARALETLMDVMGGRGPLTRGELMRELMKTGVPIDPTGQAPAHLVALAAMRGLICLGPELADDEPTYVLLDEWLDPGPSLEPEEALAELTRRYLRGHGPAGAPDLAAWAGIALGRAHRGLDLVAEELEQVKVAKEPAWIMPSEPAEPEPAGPAVRLLAAFDAYVLGYRDRALLLAPEFAHRIQAGGGWIHPAMVVDGRIAGTWKLQRRRTRATVLVEPFEPLRRALLADLEVEVADVGRFLGTEVALEVAPISN